MIILADSVNSLEKLQNIPNTYLSVGICCNKVIALSNTNKFDIFDPALMSLEMYTLLIVLMPPNLDLSFLGLITTKVLPTIR
jgi:hypothetical protein